MAITLPGDLVIYNEQLVSGYFESLVGLDEAFNERSAGAIVINSKANRGNYTYESFFATIANLVEHADLTSTSAVTPKTMTNGENISVKVTYRGGPVTPTLAALNRAGLDLGTAFMALGQEMGKTTRREVFRDAIASGVGALLSRSGLIYDATGDTSTGTLDYNALVNGMAKKGDNNDIVCWVMHSKPYYDLMKNALTVSVDSVAGATIVTGNIASLNRPIVVIDSPYLYSSVTSPSSYTRYRTLGLTQNALTCILDPASQLTLVEGPLGGYESPIYRAQANADYTFGVKGFKWDSNSGGINPTTAEMATSGNWDLNVSNERTACGVMIYSK